MTRRVALHAGVFAMIMTVVGCGDKIETTLPTPTGPTTLAPLFIPRLNGLWGGAVTLTGIAGGAGPARAAGALECVGAAFIAVMGESNDSTLSITQTSTDPRAQVITARLTSAGTGLACTYTGRVGSNGYIDLQSATCEQQPLVFRCPPDANGVESVRRLTLVGSSITATFAGPVDVTALSGTAAHSYNIDGVGGLVANHTFTSFTRR
jgi:hypothetical protein